MSVVDEVKAQLDLVDVVSDSVTLKKSGRNYTGFCPFHANTKTPSFVVFPDSQTWRCFGACADGGDLFSYVMKREGCDFKEALQLLAQRAGLSLDSDPRKAASAEQLNKFFELNAAAAMYFHRLLTGSPAGAQSRDYLAGRGLTAETVATFQLGYALDEWEALKSHFLERGYSQVDLLAAGLIVEREDGSSTYDRFRQRLMIPIRDPRGRVIGFGARALGPNQVPKYLNSPQTKLFDKSATLYGLDLARKHIQEQDQAVVVEGYMDVIQAYQRGARNLVAQMGTALTEAQLKLLKRTTSNFVLALDADSAGNAATLRGINVARAALERETVPVPTASGLIRYEGRLQANIRIATLPPGQDPDDIIKEGLEVWQAIIAQALPVVDFYFQTVTTGHDLATAKGKSAVVRALIPILREISNPIERKHYIQKLARLIHIDERTLTAEVNGGAPTKGSRQGGPGRAGVRPPLAEIPPDQVVTATVETRSGPNARLEAYCLGLILANPAALVLATNLLEQHQVPGLTVNDLSLGDHREIFKGIQLWSASQTPKFEMLVEIVGADLAPKLNQLASQGQHTPAVPSENVGRDLSLAILRLRLQNVTEQINELTFLQRETIEEQSIREARPYMEMVDQYKQQRKKLEQLQDNLSLVGQRRLEIDPFSQTV
jgi:DNA primase